MPKRKVLWLGLCGVLILGLGWAALQFYQRKIKPVHITGTVASAKQLPFLAAEVALLNPQQSISFSLYRDPMTNRFLYAVSGITTRSDFDRYANQHQVEVDEISSDVSWNLLEDAQGNPGITTAFTINKDVGCWGTHRQLGSTKVDNLEIYFRNDDGRFTAVFAK